MLTSRAPEINRERAFEVFGRRYALTNVSNHFNKINLFIFAKFIISAWNSSRSKLERIDRQKLAIVLSRWKDKRGGGEDILAPRTNTNTNTKTNTIYGVAIESTRSLM